MTAEETPTPRVLVVGAYERDNFGDLLFLLVTEPYLTGVEVVPSAPFSADMTALLDRQVHAYGPLLSKERFDVVWTVGGQVGGTDLRSAYRMSAPPDDYRRFQQSTEEQKAEILRRAVGDVPIVAPYIPSLSAFPVNSGTIGVLNSVGLSGVRGVRPSRREELVALIRGQDFVTVRDKPSSEYLDELGIEHRMVPDAVHAISRLRPAERVPDSDVAIFQASSSILKNLGHAHVAKALATSEHLRGLKIRLLLAGAATSHDSVEDFAELVAHVKRIDRRADIEVIEDRRPFDLVDHMRQARVVIGTSLHVRIIACAYGVPRVTLSRAKPTMYAKTWDDQMPFDVSVDGIDAAVGKALALADRPDILERSSELSRLAHENLTDLAKQVTELARSQSEADIARRAEARERDLVTLVEGQRRAREVEIAALKQTLAEKDQVISDLEAEVRRARRELADIKGGRSYRLARRAVTAARRIQRVVGRRSTGR